MEHNLQILLRFLFGFSGLNLLPISLQECLMKWMESRQEESDAAQVLGLSSIMDATVMQWDSLFLHL